MSICGEEEEEQVGRLKAKEGEVVNLIQQETAAGIWQCYREIESGKKLLKDMEEIKEKHPRDPHVQYLKDVSPGLAESVIRAHIAAKKAELIEINERARIELKEIPPGL